MCPTFPDMFPFISSSVSACVGIYEGPVPDSPQYRWKRPYEGFNLTLTIQNVSIIPHPIRVSVFNPNCNYPNTMLAYNAKELCKTPNGSEGWERNCMS